MADNSATKTAADYIAIALSPLLIMALVGSLVFFLVEVLYVGQYQGTLLYVFFFFVFGAVLVSRMSMTQDTSNRAGMYGLVLGGLTWAALLKYVEYPKESPVADWAWAINLGLLVLIWWSAHRLTWDCTMIEDDEDATGTGVLQAAGLDSGPDGRAEPAPPEPAPETRGKRRKRKEAGLVAWFERYQRYRAEGRKRPHTPGVWVVYFSLAALPLFGLGQSLIPSDAGDRRRHAFWMLTIYVASGLGLLVTTCFLGLRRYLRQKKVQMPAKITAAWMFSGAVLIVLFLGLGALLPRPAAEYALIDLPWLARSKDRDASKWAMRGNEAGKGEGREMAEGKEEDQEDGENKEGGERSGEAGKGKSGGQRQGSSKEKSQGSGQGKGGSQKGDKSGQGSGSKSQEKGGSKGQGSSQGKGEQQQGKQQGAAKGRQQSGRNQEQKGSKQEKPGEKGQQKTEQSQGSKSSSSSQSSSSLGSLMAKLAVFLKWVVLAVFVVLVLFFLVRALLSFLANFTDWAQNLLSFFRAFWEGLWRRREEGAGSGDGAGQGAVVRPVPFSFFPDPFLTGRAEGMSDRELLRYSFEALQSWAWERGVPRQPGETPLEFAERVGQEAPALEAEVRRLARYVAGLAYGRQTPPKECREDLRRFWQMLTEVHERPLSAGAASAV
jgi:hypothetical protein